MRHCLAAVALLASIASTAQAQQITITAAITSPSDGQQFNGSIGQPIVVSFAGTHSYQVSGAQANQNYNRSATYSVGGGGLTADSWTGGEATTTDAGGATPQRFRYTSGNLTFYASSGVQQKNASASTSVTNLPAGWTANPGNSTGQNIIFKIYGE